jgi:ferric-dicitrate binding protein FerR (iron transport regulator)
VAVALCAVPAPAVAAPPDDVAAPSVEAGALDSSRAAADGDWVVLQTAGRATWRPQGSVRWLALANSQVLPAGSEVESGPAGELILVLGGDRVVVGTNSRLVLPARNRGEDRRLRVERGRLRLDVESRPGRDVEVRTPLLSLGIKGTSIEVAVDAEESSVLVLEGRITATTPGEEPAELGAGEGLRQAAEPGSAPERLGIADLPARADRRAPMRWHLPPPAATSTAAAPSAPGPVGSAAAAPALVAQQPATRRQPSSAPRSSASRREGWLDDQTSLLTILLIAAGGLMILVMPGMVLGQSLRQQWRDRAGAKGRRRRGLTEG